MITGDQLFAHAVGDYLLQSNWMATQKTNAHLPAALHAVTYAISFLAFRPQKRALALIIGTHFLIDRYRLARYAVWVKNGPWHERTATGYSELTPPFLAVWLLIIADNILHVGINGLALGMRR